MMTVGKLIEMLQYFDYDMPVIIGIEQNYGTDFATKIVDVEEHNVSAFYGDDYEAVVIKEGSQIGSVDWDD